MKKWRSLPWCLVLTCWLSANPPAAHAADDPVEAPHDKPLAALRVLEEKAAPAGPATEVIESIPKRDPASRCRYLVTVADDFIVEVYHNGKLVPDAKRQLLLDRFGASAEKMQIAVRDGDWLVFHVVHNRFRWEGSKYFAVAGCFAENEFGFVSSPTAPEWSVCDDPGKAPAFIRQRNIGSNTRPAVIETPWGEGDQFIKEFAGKDFAGQALWGRAPSTWIKYVAGLRNGGAVEAGLEEVTEARHPLLPKPALSPMVPARWPVQILSATYGTGGKNADVTAKVKEHVETAQRMFAVNPKALGADPNPYWNKGLHIVYMKDGVRREQRRNENEHVLPESFYGPQDAAELRGWLPESRWFGEQPEVQFHADQTFTSPGVTGTSRWETTGANKLRLTGSDDRAVDYQFDYTWNSFSEVGNGKHVFHLKK